MLVFKSLFEAFARRIEAMEYLSEHADWEFSMPVITETDRLHHFVFDSARGETAYSEVFKKFYSEMDGFVGKMAMKAKKDGAIFLTCSHHGAKMIRDAICVNEWPGQKGYLLLKSPCDTMQKLPVDMIDRSKTSACGEGGYCSHIFLNVEGRETREKFDPTTMSSSGTD